MSTITNITKVEQTQQMMLSSSSTTIATATMQGIYIPNFQQSFRHDSRVSTPKAPNLACRTFSSFPGLRTFPRNPIPPSPDIQTPNSKASAHIPTNDHEASDLELPGTTIPLEQTILNACTTEMALPNTSFPSFQSGAISATSMASLSVGAATSSHAPTQLTPSPSPQNETSQNREPSVPEQNIPSLSKKRTPSLQLLKQDVPQIQSPPKRNSLYLYDETTAKLGNLCAQTTIQFSDANYQTTIQQLASSNYGTFTKIINELYKTAKADRASWIAVKASEVFGTVQHVDNISSDRITRIAKDLLTELLEAHTRNLDTGKCCIIC